MEIRQLEYFLTVAEQGNITKASEILFVSQSTISKSLKQLEDEVKTTLFERSNEGVQLTYMGQQFKVKTEELMELHNELLNFSQAPDHNLKGSLNIGISSGLYAVFSTPILTFSKQYPQVKLNFYEDGFLNIQEAVKTKLINVGIGPIYADYFPLDTDYLHGKTLKDDYLLCLMTKNNPLASSTKISLEDLVDKQVILLDSSYSISNILKKEFMAIAPEKKFIESSDWRFILELVKNYDGFSFFPMSIDQTAFGHEFQLIELAETLKSTLSVITSADEAPSEVMTTFSNWLVSYFENENNGN